MWPGRCTVEDNSRILQECALNIFCPVQGKWSHQQDPERDARGQMYSYRSKSALLQQAIFSRGLALPAAFRCDCGALKWQRRGAAIEGASHTQNHTELLVDHWASPGPGHRADRGACVVAPCSFCNHSLVRRLSDWSFVLFDWYVGRSTHLIDFSCVMPSLFPYRIQRGSKEPVRSYSSFCQYLLDLSPENEFETANLQFQGRNKVIFWKPRKAEIQPT